MSDSFAMSKPALLLSASRSVFVMSDMSSLSATRSNVVLSGLVTGSPLTKDTSSREIRLTAKLVALFLEFIRFGA